MREVPVVVVQAFVSSALGKFSMNILSVHKMGEARFAWKREFLLRLRPL